MKNKFLKIFVIVNVLNFIPVRACSERIHEFSKEFCQNPIYLIIPERKISEFINFYQIPHESKNDSNIFNSSLRSQLISRCPNKFKIIKIFKRDFLK